MSAPYWWSSVEELGRSGLDCLERYEADGDGAVLAAARRWPVDGDDPRAGGYVRMIEGLARHDRYGLTGERGDLDRAVLLLAGALPDLPDDTPWLAVATLTLAIAYRDRYAMT